MKMTHHRVLVVEPDPAIRALIVAVLRRRGHIADTAGTADEALELQRTFHPAAVVVEPRIVGGPALLDELGRADGEAHPAVIVVTMPDGREPSCAEVPPVRAVLHKPFRIDELADAVLACCETN